MFKKLINSSGCHKKKVVYKLSYIQKIGYKGEAFVYETLIETGKFKEVIWEAMSKKKSKLSIVSYSGKKYYIEEDGKHYDLRAIDHNGVEFYFEVKSSCTDGKIINLSPKQSIVAETVNPKKFKFFIATVFNSDTPNPSVSFYSKVPNDIFINDKTG